MRTEQKLIENLMAQIALRDSIIDVSEEQIKNLKDQSEIYECIKKSDENIINIQEKEIAILKEQLK